MSITSRPYRPAMACPACVWHRGSHADWCDVPIRFMGMTVTTDPTMEPGTIRLENTAGDCLGTIVNVGAQRSDAFIEYCSALIRLGPPPNEPPAGPWADLFAQPKEKS